MKRIIFLNRFFFPDHSATSQILTDLAFHLAGSGINIHVITSRQLYDQANARLPTQDSVRSVQIHRISTTHFGRLATTAPWRRCQNVILRRDREQRDFSAPRAANAACRSA